MTESRNKNLRQLLVRTTRTFNALIAEELAKRGYQNVRLAHSTLLASLDEGGNSVTVLAARAQTTKQAAGVLAQELEEMGLIVRGRAESDARTRLLTFTGAGHTLMLETFAIVRAIEDRYTAILGQATMDGLRTGLAAILGLQQLP